MQDSASENRSISEANYREQLPECCLFYDSSSDLVFVTKLQHANSLDLLEMHQLYYI